MCDFIFHRVSKNGNAAGCMDHLDGMLRCYAFSMYVKWLTGSDQPLKCIRYGGCVPFADQRAADVRTRNHAAGSILKGVCDIVAALPEQFNHSAIALLPFPGNDLQLLVQIGVIGVDIETYNMIFYLILFCRQFDAAHKFDPISGSGLCSSCRSCRRFMVCQCDSTQTGFGSSIDHLFRGHAAI